MYMSVSKCPPNFPDYTHLHSEIVFDNVVFDSLPEPLQNPPLTQYLSLILMVLRRSFLLITEILSTLFG